MLSLPVNMAVCHVCVRLALFQQTFLPSATLNNTDVNCLLEQVRPDSV